MATLGEKLRREREVRGVSVKEISEATRIHVNFLNALEENDFGSLPGGVFVTGFLRNYAVHLGLDADKIVAEYEAMKIEEPAEHVIPHVPEMEGNRFAVIGVIGTLILFLIVYVAYVNWPRIGPEDRKAEIGTVTKTAPKAAAEKSEPKVEDISKEAAAKESETAPAEGVKTEPAAKDKPKKEPADAVKAGKEPLPAVKPAKKPLSPVVEPKKATAAAVKPKKEIQPVKKKAAAETAPKKEYKYRLVVSAQEEDAWILVVVDDELVRDMFVRAGQRIIIRGNYSFNFTTGNAKHIKLFLNGKPLDFDAPPGNVIRSWNLPLPVVE
jgi:cytoskeleton protein RodZ